MKLTCYNPRWQPVIGLVLLCSSWFGARVAHAKQQTLHYQLNAAAYPGLMSYYRAGALLPLSRMRQIAPGNSRLWYASPPKDTGLFDIVIKRSYSERLAEIEYEALALLNKDRDDMCPVVRPLALLSGPNPALQNAASVSAFSVDLVAVEKIDGSPLDIGFQPNRRIAARPIQGLLRALSYTHKRGVVHRDVKPANVLERWSDHHIQLIDFEMSAKTGREVYVGGTPEFCAPEAWFGDTTIADPRSDLYAAIVMLAYKLSHRPLWPHAHTEAELMTAKRAGETDFSGIPDVFQPFVKKSLHPEPAYRYQSADETLDALNDALTEE